MDTHGFDSYFVLGEGRLARGFEGEERAPSAAAAGAPSAAAAEEEPVFRFSRMGPKGSRQLSAAARRQIAGAMAGGGGRASQIPAGFTYLGQFIDHDLTFDVTKVALGEHVSPGQLVQARSPSLDLDCLYGAGPADPESERFYDDDGIHLRMGRTVRVGGDAAMDGFDLPRGAGRSAAAKRRAVIPDPRNDENLAVGQTHLAFIRFHNRVVDTLPRSIPATRRFARARALVTKHYQWMIRTDFLPRVCAAAVLNDVFANGRKAFEPGADPMTVPTMPIEFSVAAFRFGHSMVRADYNWNARFDDGSGTLGLLFLFSGTSGNLNGEPRLPSNWIADFRRLYDFGEAGRSNLTVPADKFNRAMRIDTRLAVPLKDLPGITGPGSGSNPQANLAFRNLTRAKMIRLASGRQMVDFLAGKGIAVTALRDDEILGGNNGADLGGLTPTQRAALVANPPLWFYVLREAELNRGKLDGVGARIVAETFHRALEGSRHSIVRDPSWRPSLGPDDSTFRMVDLLLFAFEGKKRLLAPLG